MRARKINEEPKDSRNAEGTGPASVDTDDAEVWADDSLIHSTLDRVRARENLRTCLACGQEVLQHEWVGHLKRAHSSPKTTNLVPEGYYACTSGREFYLPLISNRGPCLWICSICGHEKFYFGKGDYHGGPDRRLLDRRYGLTYCDNGRYPDHKRAFGKIDGAAGPVIFYHKGAPNPPQPDQDDPAIKKLMEGTSAKGVQGRTKTKTSRARISRSTR